MPATSIDNPKGGFLGRIVDFCLFNKLVVGILFLFFISWGIAVAPFDWEIGNLPRNPVPVDAIPDIGENQQIVFTEWMGRSPQDIEDQVTYPLTVALLGIPGVETVRSNSMFGFSIIYVLFSEDVEFYWSRTRVLEKLASLPAGTLPTGVQPTLGPDATPLGQVFWYTIEGRDEQGNVTGGWDLDELRSVQDWYVRYALLSAGGVSDVGSIGGFVREYQVDVHPDALRAYDVSLDEVVNAVRMSNLDVGARTIEINRVEYVIRGIGFIRTLSDLEDTVITARDDQPVLLSDVAHVAQGPALRRGVMDKGGAEVVGGVVTVRYGENPLEVIGNIKAKIEEISPGLPSKILPDGTTSTLTIVPFYDRTGLILETLETLQTALTEQVLVTVAVVLLAIMHLASSLIVSALLPIAVLMSFIAMKLFNVDANVVALAGIAIAIGTMVDMGIIVSENILRHMSAASPGESRIVIIRRATVEVGGAITTAMATTIVSFLPVFTMTAAEGRLFKPLAFTKTFALVASIIVALALIPPLAHLFFRRRGEGGSWFLQAWLLPLVLAVAGVLAIIFAPWWLGVIFLLFAVGNFLRHRLSDRWAAVVRRIETTVLAIAVIHVLAAFWMPLGSVPGSVRNFLFVAVLIFGLLLIFLSFQYFYPRMLRWCLNHKPLFLSLPLMLVLLGMMVWLGAGTFASRLPHQVQQWRPVAALENAFPGLGREFMPPLDEGSFLFMPMTMSHASIDEVHDVLRKQNIAITAIPEVETVVGKLGRAETPLDPAPISMIETIINYHPEFMVDARGRLLSFRHDPDRLDYFRDPYGEPVPAGDGLPYLVRGKFLRDDEGRLVPDASGRPFRLWRPGLDSALNPERAAWAGISRPQDIWDQITARAEMPGTTSAPYLQPIAARIVMLQSGMRAPMGVKVFGPDQATIESVGLEIERLLKEVDSIQPAAVIADRIIGKPYLEIRIDRQALARHGIMLAQAQRVIETAVGGDTLTMTVEGRERYPVRVRYKRELRDSVEELERILVDAPGGRRIPLNQLADIVYVRGPQVIRSEDTFLTGYVLFDMRPGFAEVEVVEAARDHLLSKIETGEFVLPAGVSYTFAGTYENQIRAQQRLAVILPLSLLIIFIILFLQFRSTLTTFMVFSGIIVAWAGGFLMIWLYGQPWFMNFEIFGQNLRLLFQMNPINLSVAVWVGFLALFGIASDNGVVMATYLNQVRDARDTTDKHKIREAVIEGASRRIRPAMMTSATTILALLPVLTSTGRGSDIMVPMAIPSFGGMLLAVLTVFVVPTLYSLVEESKLRFR
ncbi:Cu(I)/Ag(I) efflux system membrane protein CusA/SilA [Desulfonatronum thiosulfatophilum]|uniref:Cu(I)/Ag(I) efflux system membrane protein CusA/SilA n=1 Tax=Desulfonatronum thiosulfatophilum TaxID=617002 RepID=A0A1G6AJI1_9BACT|nr:efflux RND transporter permease subunit [Desulfonatronum thiosulfatophilum]SDB08572.1 Cu(I)/Ag(I) efflux system membrane protein CusA/SilA [Desulfonatronum thiosulfatophilum]